ncbi:vacuolar DHA amino acid exporter [Laccaria bicolor S238N-H82]|uniref:Vacuolar DHA amino acid exporter n=1 Tax=Laccaria bicolor (strain S238N-H82 / ATCC MYA-4686) TaxID=486041 RepID=B0DBH0_LACBS|nr:vacuolar DHA amino acid exporter [Laccaria bicolor S238N-H82]EDR07995.1 vacuolar DHA amino acid exporter [Laccaria bicolor S238N-H82]|eukprot:XP_001881065.1 vacuolar DHA amino acid exporter [Laccaria bicolor S238N-H82]
MIMQSKDRQPSLPATTSIHDTGKEDPGKSTLQTPDMSATTSSTIDIEHVPVANDPRQWSSLRKNLSLFLISAASLIAGLANNVQNPAVQEMEADLPATSAQFSLSLSIFILVQGLMPLVWSAISEVKGRKLVYLVSLALFTLGSIVVALSKSIGLVIGFRALQAAGSSAVIAIGAATLADIFDPAERGTKMGVYYMAPLLGPAIGPIFGGALTTGFNWRAIFWFLSIVSGSSFLAFLFFFRDTFRRERSLTYQNAMRQRMRISPTSSPTPSNVTYTNHSLPRMGEKKKTATIQKKKESDVQALPIAKLSLMDVNPFKPILLVVRRVNNFVILIASGLTFAFGFLVAYTSARSLSMRYHYGPMKIGLVTLAYGLGCLAGSVLGGRWSDRSLSLLKAANGGKSSPEMRLKSTYLGVFLLPPSILVLGWLYQKKVHVSAICVFLFACGFFSIWTYTSTIAYIVDANNGRSSTAVATNSAFRGVMAFITTEVAVPLQDGVGDGWMYTIWALLMLSGGMLILLVSWKGGRWREQAQAREVENSEAT